MRAHDTNLRRIGGGLTALLVVLVISIMPVVAAKPGTLYTLLGMSAGAAVGTALAGGVVRGSAATTVKLLLGGLLLWAIVWAGVAVAVAVTGGEGW